MTQNPGCRWCFDTRSAPPPPPSSRRFLQSDRPTDRRTRDSRPWLCTYRLQRQHRITSNQINQSIIMSHSALKTTMARFRQLVQQVPTVQAGIQQVKYEVLGQMPRLGMRTGHQYARKQLKGVYYNQYYMDPIEKFARMVRFFCVGVGVVMRCGIALRCAALRCAPFRRMRWM